MNEAYGNIRAFVKRDKKIFNKRYVLDKQKQSTYDSETPSIVSTPVIVSFETRDLFIIALKWKRVTNLY